MREKFKTSKTNGLIKVRMDDSKGYWEASKAIIVAQIISICNKYKANGDTITLRQLYYQLVAADIIPNHDKVYKKLGSIKDDVVYSGLVDWDIFEDRGRVPIVAHSEENISSAFESVARRYWLNRQIGQPIHLEVWTEKDAISGILKRVTLNYNVDLIVNKGYSSSTAMYEAYTRFCECIMSEQKIKILYFGDHDPSGLDMIRDIRDRIGFMFTRGTRLREWEFFTKVQEWWNTRVEDFGDSSWDLIGLHPDFEKLEKLFNGSYSGGSDNVLEDLWDSALLTYYIQQNELFEVIPVGLTMDQIQLYQPPHNPAKLTDPRAAWYVNQFGPISWEVDALTPDNMRRIVEDAITEQMDLDIMEEVKDREQKERSQIKSIIEDLKNKGL